MAFDTAREKIKIEIPRSSYTDAPAPGTGEGNARQALEAIAEWAEDGVKPRRCLCCGAKESEVEHG